MLNKDSIPAKEAIQTIRSIMNGLVPEEVYLKYKRIPPEMMNVYEWVIVQVYEMVGPLKSQNKERLVEIEGQRMEHKVMNEKLIQKDVRVENLEHLLEEQKKNYERIMMEDKKHLSRVQSENKKLHVEQIDFRTRSTELIFLEKENIKLLDEVNILQNKVQLLQPVGFDITNSDNYGPELARANVKQRISDIEKGLTQTLKEKNHLVKELAIANEEKRTFEDKLAILQMRLDDAQKDTKQYIHQLMQTKDIVYSDVQQYLYKIMGKKDVYYKEDINIMRDGLVSYYDAKLRLAKDKENEFEIKFKNADMELNKLRADHDNIHLTKTQQKWNDDEEIRNLRMKYRLKDEEINSLQNLLDDAEKYKRAEHLENQTLRDKVEILRQNNAKAENKTSDQESTLRDENAILKAKLNEYEVAEEEILRAQDKLSRQDEEWRQVYMKSILGIPKGPRKQQTAVHIANRLEQKLCEVTILRNQILELQKQFYELKDDNNQAKKLLSGASNNENSNQYLMNLVLQKDAEVKEGLRIKKRQDEDYSQLRAEFFKIKEHSEDLEEKLKVLMMKRQNIENLQVVLREIISNGIEFTGKQLVDKLRNALGIIKV